MGDAGRADPNGHGKFLVCNADEGDPGAYMDRSVLEGNPHSIIEGMIIGAYATGATEGIVYVRNEYPLAIKHLTIALGRPASSGLLGTNILGTGFSFDISDRPGRRGVRLRRGDRLIALRRGQDGRAAAAPAVSRFRRASTASPTAINNVETWANIPVIIRQGAPRSPPVGTETTPAPRSSAWSARSRTPDWSKCPWA